MRTITSPEFNAEIRTWLPVEEIEAGAMEQLQNAAKHPEVGPAIAVMPDCHVGFGITIGCVFPTIDSVLPNAVGVDIGCGMCAVDTGIHYDRERMDRTFWRQWAGQIARDIPTGFSWHKRPQELGALDRPLRAGELQQLVKGKAAVQLGTLGGGNHFLEAQSDEEGRIWLMVHSGSRHTGLRIAGHYHKLAIETSRKRALAAGDDLASLPLDDETGQDYLEDMTWATDFALESRKRMIARMHEALLKQLTADDFSGIDATAGLFINIHHNFATIEEHGGLLLMVHRKGATSAYEGQLGIIPGSMGSASYIVRGIGNEASLKSCSHGAGRRMGRKAAQTAITHAEFAASLAGTYSRPSMSYVDEAPGAYKDIEAVIGRQADLVEVAHTLHPIMTFKGDSKARED